MNKQANDCLKKQQKVYSELLRKRDQALKLKCPKCKGEFKIKDLCVVQCKKCKKDFLVSDILKALLN
jgi:Zn finger protein HypA/HybF involved in hydrogenase expression